jgi:hypothetical protein
MGNKGMLVHVQLLGLPLIRTDITLVLLWENLLNDVLARTVYRRIPGPMTSRPQT